MENNRELMELLRKIDESNRRQARWTAVQCIIAFITAVCCIVMFVTVSGVMPQVNAIAGQMQTVLTNLEQVSDQLASADLAGMVTDVDTLVGTGQESLEQIMVKLNTIDFETLNKAIEDLAAVVEPLAEFFSKFS